jgi:hypothetical protein
LFRPCEECGEIFTSQSFEAVFLRDGHSRTKTAIFVRETLFSARSSSNSAFFALEQGVTFICPRKTKKGAPKRSPKPKVEVEPPHRQYPFSRYLASLNATIIRTDYLDFAIANALVCFHFDDYGNPDLQVQAQPDA